MLTTNRDCKRQGAMRAIPTLGEIEGRMAVLEVVAQSALTHALDEGDDLVDARMLAEIRKAMRQKCSELKLEDLRAISFVTSWSQLKQNIPCFYGVGTALKQMKDEGHWDGLKELYTNSGFFKTMIDNCMMSMSKSDFRITAYLADDKTFGSFWQMLKDEYDLTSQLLLSLTGSEVLMQEYPVERKSLAIREKIVLPLVILLFILFILNVPLRKILSLVVYQALCRLY